MNRKSPKERKIFLSNLNTWFSNFFIEEFRTDYLPDAKIRNTIMGTINSTGHPIPKLFEPLETQIEIGYNYNQEVFQNDYFIYNIDDANLAEIDFIIRGLNDLKYDNEKTLILISNIMTWAKTPLKIKTKEEIDRIDFNEEEFFPPVEEKEEIIEEKKEEEKKEEEKKDDDINLISRGSSKRNTLKRNTLKRNTLKRNTSKRSTLRKNTIKEEEKKEEEKKEEEKKEEEKKEEEKKEEEKKEEEKKEEEKKEEEKKELKLILTEDEIKEEDENKERIFYHKDTDYNLRIPNQKYRKYKILESKALSTTNPNLRVYIICPGFIYGCGENFFFNYFRMSYLGNPNPIPIIGKGLNSIPTIHIIDLIKIIRKVIEKKPNDKYIFAVDRTKNPSLYNIIKSISLAIGDGKIKKIDKFDINDINMDNYQELNIDVKVLPSKICLDERKLNEDIEDFNKRKFKWRCEFGIPENLDLLRDEFNLYRGLKSVKIIIIGPPSSGKSNLCKLINEKLKLPYLNISDCINEYKNEKSELGEEIRNKYIEINENLEKVIEEYEKKKAKKKNEPPLDLNEYNKLPNELLIKIIKKKINSNQCVSRGYIFDGFPKSYDDCKELYYDEIIKIIEKNEENENNEENEEKKEEEKKKEEKKKEEKKKEEEKKEENEDENIIKEKIFKKERLPDSIILISNYSEEQIKTNLSSLPDYEEKKEEIDYRFERRIKLYKTQNENENPEIKKTIDFFTENSIEIFNYDFTLSYEDQLEKLNEYLNRNGPINIYERLSEDNEIVPFIIEEEKKEEEEVEDKEYKKLLEEHSEEKENFDEENDKKEEDDDLKNSSDEEISIKDFSEEKSNEKMKVVENTFEIQLRKDKEREIQLLEKKTEILRNFLNSNVIPILSKGILNICQNLPKDPVEALCDYLTKIHFGKDLGKENIDNNGNSKNNDFSNLLNSEESSKVEEEKKEYKKKISNKNTLNNKKKKKKRY